MNWPKVLAAPGERHRPDDHADDSAGNGDRQRRLCPVRKRIPADQKRLAAAFGHGIGRNEQQECASHHTDSEPEERCGYKPETDPEDRPDHARRKAERNRGAKNEQNRESQPDGTGKERRVARKQQPNECRERQDEIPPVDDGGLGGWQFALRQSVEAALAGLQVDHPTS